MRDANRSTACSTSVEQGPWARLIQLFNIFKNKGVEGGMFFSLFVALSALLKDERRWEEEGKGGEIMSFKLSLI